jgi:exosome complex component RRP4
MTETREIVLPGELVAEKKGRKAGDGTYFEGENIFAKVLGVIWEGENEIKVIPLSGVYIPTMGDKIVGIVSSVEVSGWFVDINSPYNAFLPISEGSEEFIDSKADLNRYYDVDDVIYCKISKVTKNKTVRASMRNIGSRKLFGGVTINITPSKIPRIIGRGGSMINLIKNKTGCEIVAGQNGVIWIRGLNKAKAIETILQVEKESHTVGLTEKIEKMLSE